MKVFVSGKVGAHSRAERLMRSLEADGHTVTFDWTSIPHLRPYDQNHGMASDAADKELAGVIEADVLVLCAVPAGTGMFVELGAALALGKPVLAIWDGDAPSMFLHHAAVTRVTDEEEIRRRLRGNDKNVASLP